MHLEQIEQEIARSVHEEALNGYGVEVVMVGVKSLGLPEDITSKVIDAMKAERKREIEKYEAEGEAEARAIRERAKEARNLIVAFAERKAAQIRSEGDRVRARYFKDFKENPDLAVFIRELDALKTGLKKNTVMILDSSLMSQIKWFREGPGENLNEKPK
jgi:membrane protease subunit HflC